MEPLPDTNDYRMELSGVGDEMKYVVINKNTGVYELSTHRYFIAFDEMYGLQLAYDDIQELLAGEYGIEVELVFTPEDDGNDDGGVVH